MRSLKSLDEALVAACEAALNGDEAAPRGMRTRETLGYRFRLENPRARWVHNPVREWSSSFAIGELCWHLSGSDDVDFVAYYAPQWREYSDDGERIWGSCYGRKIFEEPHPDEPQWDQVKRLLQRDIDSRRAVLTLAKPDAHPVARKDLPCISSIQFIVRDQRLHCFGVMRSNDVIWGLSYDVFFMTMLQEVLARELDLALGWYEHYAASLHVYERHFELADRIVAQGAPLSVPAMEPMSHIEAIPEFLEVEAALRQGRPSGVRRANELPAYWQRLTAPLVQKREDMDELADAARAGG